jgi:alkaline phosphatase
MTAAALRILDNDPDGLFVVVEGGRIDTASHSNCTGCMVGEVLEFDNAVRVGLAWAADNPDTLIIVLADHETGGLEVVQSGGLGGTPSVHWTTTGHTGVRVGVFASGPRPINWPGVIDNTDIPYLLTAGEFQP